MDYDTIELHGSPAHVMEEWSGFKLVAMLDALQALANEVPGLEQQVGQYRTEYGRHNFIELDRPHVIARWPHLAGKMSEEDWAQGEGKLKLPKRPHPDQVAIKMFPGVYGKAKEATIKVLALQLVDDADLEKANESSKAIGELVTEARKVLLRAKWSQIARLFDATVGQIRDELAEHQDQLGNLSGLWELAQKRMEEQNQDPTPSPTQQQNSSTHPSPSSGEEPEPPAAPDSQATLPSEATTEDLDEEEAMLADLDQAAPTPPEAPSGEPSSEVSPPPGGGANGTHSAAEPATLPGGTES